VRRARPAEEVALVVTYVDASGAHLGTPRVIDDRSARAFSNDDE
jgi:hypothetical protein